MIEHALDYESRNLGSRPEMDTQDCSWHLLGPLASVQRESPPELHVTASVGSGHSVGHRTEGQVYLGSRPGKGKAWECSAEGGAGEGGGTGQ